MKRNFLIVAMLATLMITSCKDNAKQNNVDATTTEPTTMATDSPVTISKTDNDDNTLEMTFDNSKDIATITFNGETAELAGQKPASGIWYKNDVYELRGKGNDVTLSKNGKVVFEHEDVMIAVESKNENGDVLNLSFNTTAGTVKAYLNGGEQIDLTAEKAASGFWYKNDQYELRGKGNDLQLTKDGSVIFEHEDQKVFIETKNTQGDVLNMTFNNTEGTVQAYLNGGDQIDLTQKKAASGIWYSNEHFELRGKGDSYLLTKDGKTVFSN
ncbi:lysozyme inhibitor [Gelidibacter salicanalis]|uniref:Lysozyme inhibitor n=1 Tax=Gelidibacter salicanalis TaxID=291193 RepID=A0A5C7ANH3_9FLAO|nr:MliC family protein [Gelidibacter salicanalis]TXE07352.1 lysozyme inhibitor [Gelidibacter salicanalis]